MERETRPDVWIVALVVDLVDVSVEKGYLMQGSMHKVEVQVSPTEQA